MKRILIAFVVVLMLLLVGDIWGSLYLLNYSLTPASDRTNTEKSFKKLREWHPEVVDWLDSLHNIQALRDTFVVMPSGERHHSYFVRSNDSHKAAVVIHGWRNCAIDFMYIGRLYHQLGYNVLMPDLHAHGLSEGETIGMGWNERKDVLHWMELSANLFGADDFVVHGVSMGAATTMNVAGERLPESVRRVCFVEDCGYTSVWDEFKYKMKDEFGLQPFPLLYTSSLLCKLKYGWDFDEASPIKQISQSPHPMLFIHGDNDHFVPSWMVHPLYTAKPSQKRLWMTKGTEHALSYHDYPEDYFQQIREFLCHDWSMQAVEKH